MSPAEIREEGRRKVSELTEILGRLIILGVPIAALEPIGQHIKELRRLHPEKGTSDGS